VKVLIAAGGTAGHLLAARALFDRLVDQGLERDSAFFVTADRSLDRELIPENEFRVLRYRGEGLSRSIRRAPRDLVSSLMATSALAPHIVRARPTVAVGFGGFVSVSSLSLAKLVGARVVVVEQNAVFGRANALLQPIVSWNALCLPIDIGGSMSRRSRLIGGIVRPEVEALGLLEDPKRRARELLGIATEERVIVVVGGSLGARVLNRSVPSLLRLLSARETTVTVPVRVVHFGGTVNDDVPVGVDPAATHLTYQHFTFDKALYRWLCAADVVLSRAGASTVAELCALGVCSVLVPIAGASRDHQRENALVLERGGAALVMKEDWLSQEQRLDEVIDLVYDEERCGEMAARAREFFLPGSTGRLASMVLRLAQVGGER
jgi:UDP-N-acetylglucosamine--N-acetylmuramyl-(pentapeptide) pyrophosphoryl-undecaprenol N-acetylglucosamine transferase